MNRHTTKPATFPCGHPAVLGNTIIDRSRDRTRRRCRTCHNTRSRRSMATQRRTRKERAV